VELSKGIASIIPKYTINCSDALASPAHNIVANPDPCRYTIVPGGMPSAVQ
jgi:hypothetical protein